MSGIVGILFMAFALPCAVVLGVAVPMVLIDWLGKKLS